MTEFTENVNEEKECFICNDMTKFRNVCQCKIATCPDCLAKWLGRKRQCPHCQDDLMPFEEWSKHWKDEKMRDDLEEEPNFLDELGLTTAIAIILSVAHVSTHSDSKITFITNRLDELCYMVDQENRGHLGLADMT